MAIVAVLLAIGLAGCGGDDDPSSTMTEKLSPSSQAQSDGGSDGGEGSADSTSAERQDSGGGSAQFRTKGGDNSIQEFGEEADASDFDAAAAVLHEFLDARAAEDWDSACAAVSEEVRQSLEKLGEQAKQLDGASCTGILSALTNPAAKKILQEEAEQADVASLRVEGDSGYIIYRAAKGSVVTIPMVEEDGDWKVSGLGGTPIA